MKLRDLKPNTHYLGRGGQVRLLIRFNEARTRILYRQITRGRDNAKPVMQVGAERWVEAYSFIGWAVQECDENHSMQKSENSPLHKNEKES